MFTYVAHPVHDFAREDDDINDEDDNAEDDAGSLVVFHERVGGAHQRAREAIGQGGQPAPAWSVILTHPPPACTRVCHTHATATIVT